MQSLQQELSQERRNILQSEKATPSQLVAKERLKRAIEKRREDEMRPRVKNYNDLRGVNLEVPSSGRGEERKDAEMTVKTGVGLNSNIRRAVGPEGMIGNVVKPVRTANTKIGDEIML